MSQVATDQKDNTNALNDIYKMSTKRAATTELNHDNWDQDDPSEHEEMGTFKTASKDVLEKRVIRTAKRRAPIGDEVISINA